jgi:hypothetical protein
MVARELSRLHVESRGYGSSRVRALWNRYNDMRCDCVCIHIHIYTIIESSLQFTWGASETNPSYMCLYMCNGG